MSREHPPPPRSTIIYSIQMNDYEFNGTDIFMHAEFVPLHGTILR